MLIDLHLHTSEFSPCSKVSLEEIISEAIRKGLDGICITDHDNMLVKRAIEGKPLKDLLIVVGIEVLTTEGDILVFGVDDLPKEKVSALELTNHVLQRGGITIAAHPFRNNDRGVKRGIKNLPALNIVEGYNGNTSLDNNLKAVEIAKEVNKPIVSSSDAHTVERVGCYATSFDIKISTEKQLIEELSKGNFKPMIYDYELEEYQEIKEI